MTLDKSQYSLP